MKRKLLLVISVLNLISLLYTQDKNKCYISQRFLYLQAYNLEKTEKTLNALINDKGIKVQKQELSSNKIKIEFDIANNEWYDVENKIKELGYLTDKDYSFTDFDIVISKIEDEIQRLQTSEKENAEELISEKLKRITEYTQTKNRIFISIVIKEEEMITDEIKFVNMPGFEYGILFTENPIAGLSAPYYEMYTLKYLFTRGKSYFTLGLLKAHDYQQPDSTLYNEYFMLNFGQDFYTRHLGRGKRRFLNPYTSYQVGCFLASNAEFNNKFMFNANVAIGLELIKTRSFLLDTKVSYFLPLHKKNVNMRGVQVGISANILL